MQQTKSQVFLANDFPKESEVFSVLLGFSRSFREKLPELGSIVDLMVRGLIDLFVLRRCSHFIVVLDQLRLGGSLRLQRAEVFF